MDDFTPPDASVSQIKESVERTVLWAKKSKEHYLKLIEKNEVDKNSRPLLFSVIQGGLNKDLRNPKIHQFLYINREMYRRDTRPIGENCDCFVCQNFSRAYLHHLFNIKDTLAYRLATIHNLRTYTRLIQVLRDNTAVS